MNKKQSGKAKPKASHPWKNTPIKTPDNGEKIIPKTARMGLKA